MANYVIEPPPNSTCQASDLRLCYDTRLPSTDAKKRLFIAKVWLPVRGVFQLRERDQYHSIPFKRISSGFAWCHGRCWTASQAWRIASVQQQLTIASCRNGVQFANPLKATDFLWYVTNLAASRSRWRSVEKQNTRARAFQMRTLRDHHRALCTSALIRQVRWMTPR